MTSEILTPAVIEMLLAFENVLKQFDTDFYLVGAVARDIRLSGDPAFAAKRRTKDVDIALLIADEEKFYQVKAALLDTGNFTAHATEAVKLFYKEAIEVDLLPFGEIENEIRETRLEKPRLFVLDVPGFMEIFPHAEIVQLNEHLSLKVCPLEGLVLLKLIANDDNPSRTKDITDIEHILVVYFDICSVAIFDTDEDAADLYATDVANYIYLVSARVIGRKIAGMLATEICCIYFRFRLVTGANFSAKLMPTLFICTWPKPMLREGIFTYGEMSMDMLLLSPVSTPRDRFMEEKR